MRRKFISLVSLLVVVCLTATSVFAGDVHFDGPVVFDLGSLIANGTLVGLGKTDVTVTLTATGIPAVTCTNLGGNQAPGQNPPKVSASGKQFLAALNYSKNGKSLFGVETNNPDTNNLPAVQFGCPNNNWSASIDFVYWTNATITVYVMNTTNVLLKQNYICNTTNTTVSCAPAP